MLRQTALLIGLVAMVGVATARYGRYFRRRASYRASDGVVCPNQKRQCHPDAVCVSEAGRHNYKTQYRCQCKPGYSGNGYSCTDINECVENTHNCDDNANCTNTAGGYTCACREGFTSCGACCKRIAPLVTFNSCKAVLENDATSQDGVYTIRLENATADIQVYCDMTTDGGGWTLVYSYTFTDYANFLTIGNAVTPRPNWPRADGTDVSTTTPTALWDTQTGAMDSADWVKIGSEFLVRSNINNWVKCSPDGGSLVAFRVGPINCTIVQAVPTNPDCTLVVPNRLTIFRGAYEIGIPLDTTNYRWENSVTSATPDNTPCQGNSSSYLRVTETAGGAILLR